MELIKKPFKRKTKIKMGKSISTWEETEEQQLCEYRGR
jgi:hypothetical protein